MEFYVFLLIIATPAFARKNAEGRIREYVLNQPGYSPRERPVLNASDPVNVTLSLQIYAMVDLNEKDQTITTASWITLTWRDERLTWDPNEFEGSDNVIVYYDEIWTPSIVLTYAVKLDGMQVVTVDRGTIKLYYDGSVVLGTPYIQTTQCQMIIYYFPFDTQTCLLIFTPENQSTKELNFTTTTSWYPSSIVNNQWELLAFTATNYQADLEFSETLHTFQTGIYSLSLKRDPNYYITTIVIPSTLLCLMSYATFLAPPDSGERIGLGVSMVLGLTVFQLLVTNILPTASKNAPIISTYLTNTFVLSCLAVPFSLFNITIVYGDSKISVLRRPKFRKLLLETLPRLLFLTTYRERVQEDFGIVSKDSDIVTMATVEELPTNKVQPMQTIPATISETLGYQEKKKLEARIVGLVMDRLVLLCFLIAYMIIVIIVVLKFNSTSGMNMTWADTAV
ncbi:neuronal acetylcholine receptor subunit alpha-6-like [Apostichopus japonicus]|uniref:neuronal acetylcholine receptor subunit alpha-6-like n=1 Tax=Stichopus japonicus TaxID=307972 RepID=UPI003AB5280B